MKLLGIKFPDLDLVLLEVLHSGECVAVAVDVVVVLVVVEEELMLWWWWWWKKG